MRYSIQSQLTSDGPLPAESFGRIARCAAVPRPINGAATRSANEADINSRELNEVWALRALAGNGFGDAAIGHGRTYAHLAVAPLHADAVNGCIAGFLQSRWSESTRLRAAA